MKLQTWTVSDDPRAAALVHGAAKAADVWRDVGQRMSWTGARP
jgi:hypothetical protein